MFRALYFVVAGLAIGFTVKAFCAHGLPAIPMCMGYVVGSFLAVHWVFGDMPRLLREHYEALEELSKDGYVPSFKVQNAREEYLFCWHVFWIVVFSLYNLMVAIYAGVL